MRRRDVEDDDTVRDGETLRTPMYLMDSTQRPLLTADAARELRRTARDEYVRRLTDAWRHPPSTTNHDASEPDASEALLKRHLHGEREPDVGSAQGRRDKAWAAYKDRLSNAWRAGRTDPGRAGGIERQGEAWRHGR
jgi:hypothetical protein